jgi:hypothetical protein
LQVCIQWRFQTPPPPPPEVIVEKIEFDPLFPIDGHQLKEIHQLHLLQLLLDKFELKLVKNQDLLKDYAVQPDVLAQ